MPNTAPVLAAAPIYVSNFAGSDPVQWFSAHGDDPNVYAPDQLIPQTDGTDTYLSSVGPWWTDGNHTAPGPGYLYQIAWARLGYFAPDTGMGPPVIQDLRNGEFSFQIRADNLSLTPDAHLYFYFEGLDPNIPAAEGQMVDYEFSAVPIETLLVDGEWVQVNLTLTTDDADWLPQDSNPTRADLYSKSATIADALSGIINNAGIQLQIGQTIPVTPPSGTIQIKDIVFKGNPELHSWFKDHGANSVGQVLGIDVTVSDSDSPNFDGGGLTISYQTGGGSEDQLAIRNQGTGAGQIGVNGTNVTYGGLLIGTVAGGANGSVLTVGFNANATAVAVEALIENIFYRNTATTPQNLRTLHIILDDGDGGSTSILTEVKFGPADPVLTGTAQADTLHGSLLAATFFGLEGDDVLIGGVGPDIMNGGTGNDQYLVTNSQTTVNESVGEGSDRIFAAVSYVLTPASEVELLTTSNHGGTQAIAITGNEFGQTIYGNAGNNILNGGGGTAADVLLGLAGDDRFYVNHANDQIYESAGEGNDQVFAGVSYTLAPNVSVETLRTADDAGTAAINLTGNNLANTIRGNAGNNVLNYLADATAADTLIGLGGDDWYFVNNPGDKVFETASGGSDRVFANVSYTLRTGSEVEIISTQEHSGTAAINLTGNEFGQSIYGNAGNNLLNYLGTDGTAGDTLIGMEGNDTYFVYRTSDVVTETASQGADRVYANVSYTLAPNSSVEIFSAASQSATTAINLTGNELAQSIYGNAGNNILNGGGGSAADSLLGLAGDDRYLVNHAGDKIYESTGEGNDQALASVSYSLTANASVETLSTTDDAGTDAINLTGNNLANNVRGNAGNNILNYLGSGTAADNLTGLGGDDWYFVNNPGDMVFENSGGGNDRIFASVSYTLRLGSEVEIISTQSHAGTAAINLTGNEFGQSIYGNAGNNILNYVATDGTAGDTLVGMGGDDSYFIYRSSDVVIETAGQGTDRVYANLSYTLASSSSVEIFSTTSHGATTAINLTGNELAQSIYGNAGNNTLNGGGGNDTLTGMAGADVFQFNSPLNSSTNVDRITDFELNIDKMALDHAVFTALSGGLAADSFVTGTSALDANDYLIFNRDTGALFYDANGNGAGQSVQFATLTAGLQLQATDFLIV